MISFIFITKVQQNLYGLLESKMLDSIYVYMQKETILFNEHQESYYTCYDSVVDVDKMVPQLPE
jgi:hypothetical protein